MGQVATQFDGTLQPQESIIPLWEYNKGRHKWLQKQQGTDYPKHNWDRFHVITYNLWFSDEFQPMRFKGLCDILYKSHAQVIGLQEVTPQILKQLVAQPFIQDRYYVSDIDGRTFSASYGTVLLIDTRLRISHLNLINFPQSTMGRYLLFGEIRLDKNEILRIGTVHLESLNNEQERLNQLNICQNMLNRYPGTSILMGDFNFGATGQENINQFNALSGWVDVWVKLMGNHNPGYTFDTEINSMKNRRSKDQSRYDRIILRSQTIRPIQIKMIGTKSIGNEGHIRIFPSDHFGLTGLFEKKIKQ